MDTEAGETKNQAGRLRKTMRQRPRHKEAQENPQGENTGSRKARQREQGREEKSQPASSEGRKSGKTQERSWNPHREWGVMREALDENGLRCEGERIPGAREFKIGGSP